jgi:anti-sigma factor ChrR (cupin superfamily)
MTLGDVSMRLPVGIAIVIIASTAIARGQSLHDQAICDDHAQKAFEAHNNHGTELGITLLNGHFQSHYNAKLNKCFVLIDTVEKQQGQYQTTLTLMDAMEGRALDLFVESKSPRQHLN